jgi:hypothetical protein
MLSVGKTTEELGRVGAGYIRDRQKIDVGGLLIRMEEPDHLFQHFLRGAPRYL